MDKQEVLKLSRPHPDDCLIWDDLNDPYSRCRDLTEELNQAIDELYQEMGGDPWRQVEEIVWQRAENIYSLREIN